MKSLDKLIQNDVELHVVFKNPGYPEVFHVGKTTYYCVAVNSFKERIKNKLRSLLGKQPDVEKNLEIVKKVKPDIIHIHGTESSWIRIAPYITDVPVILSIQAVVTVLSHKYYSGIQRNDLSPLSPYRRLFNYPQIAKEERQFVQFVPYLLGRTDWDRRVYSVLAPKAKYYVSNEVLRDGFYNNVWKEPIRDDNKIIIHTTTGAHLFKGLETVCYAASLLSKIGFDFEWRVAGVNANNEFVKTIKQKLKDDYPQAGLVLLGSLSEIDLINNMLEAHIYVSPSHQDNSPNALCEATILGMPCISTCAGGSNTILKDGITGILIQDGDPWVMAGAVLELARNRQLAQQYADAARVEALDRHSKIAIEKNLIKIYNEVINN